MYAKYIKRYADFTGALILILILSPIYILLYVLIRIFISPVLFIQDRPGKEIIFRLYKFRSMNSKTDSSENYSR
ncbi:MAG: sugar transferase [Bacilli bacterium]